MVPQCCVCSGRKRDEPEDSQGTGDSLAQMKVHKQQAAELAAWQAIQLAGYNSLDASVLCAAIAPAVQQMTGSITTTGAQQHLAASLQTRMLRQVKQATSKPMPPHVAFAAAAAVAELHLCVASVHALPPTGKAAQNEQQPAHQCTRRQQQQQHASLTRPSWQQQQPPGPAATAAAAATSRRCR
jgi:hypothetical protein